MKKYLYFFIVAIFATMSVALTACGSDDEPEDGTANNSTIVVNGKSYKVFPSSDLWGMSGWRESSKGGNLYLQLEDENNTMFEFWYNSNTMPGNGDDFSKMGLTMSYDRIGQDDYQYISGTAKISDTSGSGKDRYITINFDNLTMSDGNQTFTFKGNVKLRFVDFAL